MKKAVLNLALVLTFSMLLSSCYRLTYSVGSGAQTGQETKAKNHYVVYGLAPISTSNPTQMAGGASNYEVTIVHTFIDGLISGITFGIYTPTTTIVKK